MEGLFSRSKINHFIDLFINVYKISYYILASIHSIRVSIHVSSYKLIDVKTNDVTKLITCEKLTEIFGKQPKLDYTKVLTYYINTHNYCVIIDDLFKKSKTIIL